MQKLQMDALDRLGVDEFRQTDKVPVHLVLDNVRSGMNVGSAFRTADAFAIQAVHLCGITAQPPHREILKTALGATDSVEWRYHASTAECIDHLRGVGCTIWGVEQVDKRTWLQNFKAPEQLPLALVFGNEVDGLDETLLPLLDGAIEIPQFGTKHSLNIAVSLGIVVWEVVRQLQFAK